MSAFNPADVIADQAEDDQKIEAAAALLPALDAIATAVDTATTERASAERGQILRAELAAVADRLAAAFEQVDRVGASYLSAHPEILETAQAVAVRFKEVLAEREALEGER